MSRLGGKPYSEAMEVLKDVDKEFWRKESHVALYVANAMPEACSLLWGLGFTSNNAVLFCVCFRPDKLF